VLLSSIVEISIGRPSWRLFALYTVSQGLCIQACTLWQPRCNCESLASPTQQKLPPYVVHSPFCVVLKVEGACPKMWEFNRGGNVTGITSTRPESQAKRVLKSDVHVVTNASCSFADQISIAHIQTLSERLKPQLVVGPPDIIY
jgi:hypothetical protein